jgi:hypothetical protein
MSDRNDDSSSAADSSLMVMDDDDDDDSSSPRGKYIDWNVEVPATTLDDNAASRSWEDLVPAVNVSVDDSSCGESKCHRMDPSRAVSDCTMPASCQLANDASSQPSFSPTKNSSGSGKKVTRPIPFHFSCPDRSSRRPVTPSTEELELQECRRQFRALDLNRSTVVSASSPVRAKRNQKSRSVSPPFSARPIPRTTYEPWGAHGQSIETLSRKKTVPVPFVLRVDQRPSRARSTTTTEVVASPQFRARPMPCFPPASSPPPRRARSVSPPPGPRVFCARPLPDTTFKPVFFPVRAASQVATTFILYTSLSCCILDTGSMQCYYTVQNSDRQRHYDPSPTQSSIDSLSTRESGSAPPLSHGTGAQNGPRRGRNTAPLALQGPSGSCVAL